MSIVATRMHRSLTDFICGPTDMYEIIQFHPFLSDCVSDIGAANPTASGDMVLNSQRQSGHPLDRLLPAQWM